MGNRNNQNQSPLDYGQDQQDTDIHWGWGIGLGVLAGVAFSLIGHGIDVALTGDKITLNLQQVN